MPDTNPLPQTTPQFIIEGQSALWEPTAAECEALDRCVAAIGPLRMPGEWSVVHADDGSFSIALGWQSGTNYAGPMGTFMPLDGAWAAFEGQVLADDEAVAEASTLADLAETMAEHWGGEGRWQLAA